MKHRNTYRYEVAQQRRRERSFSEKKARQIIAAIEAGRSLYQAAHESGVPGSAVRRWLLAGRDAVELDEGVGWFTVQVDRLRAQKEGQILAAQRAIIDAMAQGSYFAVACRAVGVRPATARSWLGMGRKAIDPESVLGVQCEPKEAYSEFVCDYEAVSAVVEVKMVAGWVQEAEKDWRAAQAFLERRYPKRWARQDEPVLAVAPIQLALSWDEATDDTSH